ncbi:MAG: PAS domain-containing sensor histidine kinase [Rhodothermales bacterium]
MDDRMEHAPCGFLRLADDGTVVATNATLHQLMGAAEGELVGAFINDLLTPGARIFYQTHVFPMLRMHGRVDEIYLSLRTADEQDLPVLLNGVRREAEGVSDWVMVPMRRRSRFEDELLQAKKAAQEASRAKERFLGMLSHDLRAPLSGISMAAGMLGKGMLGPVSDRQQHELNRIKDASQYVLRLMKDLLNYARLEAGRAEISLEPVDLHEAAVRALGMVAHLAEEREQRVELVEPTGALFGLAQPDRLQQVLLNLLTNAIKYTGIGGNVTLTVTSDAEQVAMHIRDTGQGIPAERLDQIFQPFLQLDSTHIHKDGSVGLGLAISRELIRLMNGEISVASTVGEGSTFTVTLVRATSDTGAS